MDKPKPKQKIAVIGSGVCGAATANYLSSVFPDIEITVFERSNHVGGRANHTDYRGMHAELGAGFFIEANKCVVDFANKFKLKRKESLKDKHSFICWDGSNILYNSEKRFHSLRMLYNFGWSLFWLRRYLNRTLRRFLDCYPRIDLGNPATRALESPQEFTRVVGMEEALAATGSEHVKTIGLKDAFINTFLYGVVCGIYNNRIKKINAMALMVSLQGMFQKAYSFADGNSTLPKSILEDAKNTKVKLETEVNEVIYNSQSKNYRVKYREKGKEAVQSGEFSIVVIATPLKQSGVKITGVRLKEHLELTNFNKKVHITLIEGKVNNEFFGLPGNSKPIESIVFVEGFEKKMPGVNSFDQVKDFGDGTYLYRFESDAVIPPKMLSSLFGNYKIVKQHVWDFAYPSLPPVKSSQLIGFRLNRGLYFPSAMEFTASCMEMQCIAAKNVVKMIMEREGSSWEQIIPEK